MNALVGGTWEQFSYGKACVSRAALGMKAPRRGKAKAISFPRIGASVSTATPFPALPTIGQVVAQPRLGEVFRNVRDWGSSFNWSRILKRCRKTLSLTQDEVAKLTGLHLSTIQKIEQEDTKRPDSSTIEQLRTLTELEEILRRGLNGKRYAISAALRSPSAVFGNETPLEFSGKVQRDGLLEVVSNFRRIYG